MGSSVAGKHSEKQNMGQKTPIHHNKARQSVVKKQTSKVKQGMFCYYVTNLKRIIRTSSKTAGLYKVQNLCLKLVKMKAKDEDLPTNNLARREVDHSFFFYAYMPTEITCILLSFTTYVSDGILGY